MKLILIAVTLLLTQLIYAQTLRAKKNKEEMLKRADLIITKVDAAREDLNGENVLKACSGLKQILKIYPAHLESFAQYLDQSKRRIQKSTERALKQLALTHKQTLICSKGKEAEYVDLNDLDKELKRLKISLKKQKRIIKNSDTDFNNSYSYWYESYIF